MFNIIIFIFLFYSNICVNGNIYGTIDSLYVNNETVCKFVAYNIEDHNRVCIILQLNSRLVINFKKDNTTKDISIGLNSSLNINCTGIYRELVIKIDMVQIHLVWEREPDPYEHGEIGWSSVGAPANTTSGTYALCRINVSLPLSMITHTPGRDQIVHFSNADHERFKTRSGDHYSCDAKISFELYPHNDSVVAVSSLVNVILEMDNSKMQAYSDLNVSYFTGTPQMCPQDLLSDSGVAIGIGVAVAVLIFAVLAFLAIGRLKEKDQQYQELDAGKWAAVHS